MNFIGKLKSQKGITLILLIIVIIIMVAIVSMIVKGIFDFKTVGATSYKGIDNSEAVGKYVEYIPEGGTYSVLTNNDYNFETDTNLKWRIWSIDNEKLTIISDKPTSVGGYKNLGALYLANCDGYNNSVNILNEICYACYNNSNYKSVARSLNIDDIEGVLNRSIWSPESYSKKKIEAKTYSGRKEYTTNTYYPYIYSLERFSSIDSIELGEENGIGRSEQSTLCNVGDTYLKANTILNPMQTGWANSNMKPYNFINENYYYLIFKEGFQERETLMSYFLASRAVDLNDSYINFGVFEVSMGKEIQTTTLFNSRGASLEYWDRIRPVVEIPIENINLDRSTDGLTPETAWRI